MPPFSTLSSLPHLRNYRSLRVSSFDRTGGNRDWVEVDAGETKTLAEIKGPGCIRHIWMTMGFPHDDYLRRVILRLYWDGASEPSVECPIGDFFGLGHARRKNFVTAVLMMSPEDGRGFNSWWPMPFRRGARLEVVNQGEQRYNHYFYVDYEAYDSAARVDGQAYFHTQWRREFCTQGWGDEYDKFVAPGGKLTERSRFFEPRPKEWFDKTWFGGDPRSLNKGDAAADNYVILAAAGDGVYCGAHLDIDVFNRQKNDWYGEGDDMVFIDDDLDPAFDPMAWAGMGSDQMGDRSPTGLLGVRAPNRKKTGRRPVPHKGGPTHAGILRWPPSLHGTGTEDWNHCAFCPTQEYQSPYHGVLLYSGDAKWRWRGKQSIYRYHVEDPLRFRKRILVSIEHGHANKLSNDYSSTAYYYLSEPHRGGPPLPPVDARLPRPDAAPSKKRPKR